MESKQTKKKKIKDKEKKKVRDVAEVLIEAESLEELEEILKKISNKDETGSKKIRIKNRLLDNIFYNLGIMLIINALLTWAIVGYFDIFDFEHLYQLLIYISIFTIVDTLVKDLIYDKLPYLVISSGGLIIMVLSIVWSILIQWLLPDFSYISVGFASIYLSSFLLVRMLLVKGLKGLFTRIRIRSIKRRIKR